jgi:hypothetical protein
MDKSSILKLNFIQLLFKTELAVQELTHNVHLSFSLHTIIYAQLIMSDEKILKSKTIRRKSFASWTIKSSMDTNVGQVKSKVCVELPYMSLPQSYPLRSLDIHLPILQCLPPYTWPNLLNTWYIWYSVILNQKTTIIIIYYRCQNVAATFLFSNACLMHLIEG